MPFSIYPAQVKTMHSSWPDGGWQVHGESHLYIGSKFSVADNLESTVHCLETNLEPGMKNYLFLSKRLACTCYNLISK